MLWGFFTHVGDPATYWAIVPFEEFMHGASELAPLIGTYDLQPVVEQHNFGRLSSSAVQHNALGKPPQGQWKAAADDATLVAAFNAAPNKLRFG